MKPIKDTRSSNFIKDIIKEDLASGEVKKIHTRFPPEPNGYLHIGHAKSICLNYGLAEEFYGICNLRMDDTNPEKEEPEYVESIVEDLKWLGFYRGEKLFYASDYFDRLYEYAIELIKKATAYVDDLSSDEIRRYRGTLTEAGRESPYRNRPVEENLNLFERMRAGEFDEGSKTLRAKIDMSSGNINMRDPVMYRIIKAPHYRAGDKWRIYPTYDWAHGQCDSIEGITHSVCTLEFEDHRPLYNWFIEALGIHHPRQIEFARLNISHTVLSKRKLLKLVKDGHVAGWDDPRMPTLSGLRRRGYTPEAVKDFAERIGVSKKESTVDMALLEHCLREDLNKTARRVMAVLRPLKVVIENYPEDETEELDAVNNPEDPSVGTRKIFFSKTVYIERDDFMETPSKGFHRLSPGKEVRLKHAYIIKCESIVKDPVTGDITEIRCTYDPSTKSGASEEGRKVKGTLHWVSAAHAAPAEVRLYDKLFLKHDPDEDAGTDFTENLNPKSLEILKGCYVEPSLKDAPAGSKYQFLRLGYFCVDKDSTVELPVFNLSVGIKDTWSKVQSKGS